MAFNFSINPKTFGSAKIATPSEQSQFLFKLAQALSEIESSINQVAQGFTSTTSNLGALTGNTTFNANGSQIVSISFTFAVAFTLTINNLPTGAVLQMNMTNTSGAAKIVTGVATTPGGTFYTTWLVDAPAAQKNLLTGWSFAVGTLYVLGVTMSDFSIQQIAQ